MVMLHVGTILHALSYSSALYSSNIEDATGTLRACARGLEKKKHGHANYLPVSTIQNWGGKTNLAWATFVPKVGNP